MALDRAWFAPVILNPNGKPSLLHPMPVDHPKRIDDVSNEGPFAVHDEFLACPKKVPYNILRNDDIEKSQPKWTIKEPLDPLTLDKPYPENWLVGAEEKKKKKLEGNLSTERHTNPLDPKYKLASGESIMPCGNSDHFSNRVSNPMDCSDIVGAKPTEYYKRPRRECRGSCEPDPTTRPAKLTHTRTRCNVGGCLNLADISLGKKHFGFMRYPETNPVEPFYANEAHETPAMKYKRLKKAILPAHKEKWNVCERALDVMYWKSEQLPDVCRRYGDLYSGCVDYAGLRKSLEQFGLSFNDKDYARLLRFADKEGRGVVNARDFAAQLRHNDGLEMDQAQKLGYNLGVNWGHCKYEAQKPTCMGQGCAVIVEEPKQGRTKIVWADSEQKYNPFTGEILPYQRPAMMSTGNSFQYNLNEVQAAEFMKKREENYYIPGAYVPRGSIPVTHSCAISKSCTLPHVFLEGTSDHPEGEHHHHVHQHIPDPRGSAILGPDALARALPAADPEVFQLFQPQLSKASVSFQLPARIPVEMGGRPSLLDTTKGMGAIVRKASLEGRKLSEGFIKLPNLTGIHSIPIPLNSAKGDEVMWRRVGAPRAPKQPFVSYKDRVRTNNRIADIDIVRGLILP
ncbi:hypothetical protein R1flu_027828 [Riccia fluitans]|uniref:EF-hand domain-containing protein n=1 Tax=Riccia fluitans TaxID=41844 RepID=A0ABD1XK18_9MARC